MSLFTTAYASPSKYKDARRFYRRRKPCWKWTRWRYQQKANSYWDLMLTRYHLHLKRGVVEEEERQYAASGINEKEKEKEHRSAHYLILDIDASSSLIIPL
jgi:hypothetical protein